MKRFYTLFLGILLLNLLNGQVVTNGLIAHFRLDGNTDDISSVNIDGAGTALTPTTDRNGASNSAMQFVPASMSNVDATTDNRGIAGSVTVSAWIKTTNTTTQRIFDKYDFNVDAGFYLEVYQNNALLGGRNGAGTFFYLQGSTVVNDGQWHHICGRINGNTWQLWVDCSLEDTYTSTAPSPTLVNSYPLLLGYSFYGATIADPRYFDGSIDEVRLYNRSITNLEIDSICMLVEPFIGISEYGEDTDFEIFPNPTIDVINIKDFNSENFTVKIYNILGEEVVSSINEQQIDVSMLVSGTYMVHVTDESKHLFGKKKLIIQ